MTINKENLLENQPKKSLSGLYTIICLNNHRQYIGQSTNVTNRLSKHLSQLKKNCHFCKDLQTDFNLYTQKNFVIQRLSLGEAIDKKLRENIEITLIELIPKEFLYNKFASPSQRTGSLNGFYGHKHTEETKKKISLANSVSTVKRQRKPVQINNVIYASVAEAERQTGIARRLIRKRCHEEYHTNYQWVNQDS